MKEERRGHEVEQLTFNNLQSKSDCSLHGIRQTENDIYVHNHHNIVRGNRYELHSDGDGSVSCLLQRGKSSGSQDCFSSLSS